MKKWYCCSKCKAVGYYYVHDDGTTSFDRGEYLAHNEWLTTGFDTKKEADECLEQELNEPKGLNDLEKIS